MRRVEPRDRSGHTHLRPRNGGRSGGAGRRVHGVEGEPLLVRDNALDLSRGAAMYGLLYRVVLRRLPAEGAHRAGFWVIRAVAGVPGGAWALRRWLGARDPVLRVRALGLEFPGPGGLAA